MYECKDCSFRWNLPVGRSTANCTIIGDVLGHWVINGTIWHMLLTSFQESECFRTVEKHVRTMTENSLHLALSKHAAVTHLPPEGRLQLQSALLQHCLGTPDADLLKSWLHTYARMVLLPLVPPFAQGLVAAWGSFVNLDFSSSDSKQLLQRKRQRKTGKTRQLQPDPAAARHRRYKGKLWAGAKQLGGRKDTQGGAHRKLRKTWGALTGLFDIPLLPALFAPVEDMTSKLQLLQVAFRRGLAGHRGATSEVLFLFQKWPCPTSSVYPNIH